MPGHIDEISHAIGELGANLRSLDKTLRDHCDDDDRRHAENIDVLRDINRKLDDMQPIVAGLQAMKLRAVWLALALLGFVGWLVEQVISNAIKWLFASH